MNKSEREWLRFQIQMMERQGGFEEDSALRTEYTAFVTRLEEEERKVNK